MVIHIEKIPESLSQKPINSFPVYEYIKCTILLLWIIELIISYSADHDTLCFPEFNYPQAVPGGYPMFLSHSSSTVASSESLDI